MTSNSRESKAKEEPREEDHFKTLMRMSSKYPNSVAFQDFADARVSPEQRLLEMKLETMIEQFNDVQKKRVTYWSTPNGPSPILLDSFEPPNLSELRKLRLSELSSAAKAQRPMDASRMSNALLEESKAAAARLNTEAAATPLLLSFFQRHCHRAAATHHLLLRRAAEHRPMLPTANSAPPSSSVRAAASGGEGGWDEDGGAGAELGALLDQRIEATLREHALAYHAAEKLR